MGSNRICAREGAAELSSSFKNTVRISTDLSVFVVVLVISISIRGLVSMNLMTKGALRSLVVINFQCLLSFVGNPTVRYCWQQPGDKTSQLIEVIRVR